MAYSIQLNMRLYLLILICTITALVYAAGPVHVCRDDIPDPDPCTCNIVSDFDNHTSLLINCENWPELDTTNIVVNESFVKNLTFVNMRFVNTGITQLINPLVNNQLVDKIRYFEMEQHTIRRIDAKVFDKMPKLERLIFVRDGINEDVLNNGWLTPTVGKSLLFIDFSHNDIKMIQKGTFNNLASVVEIDIKYSRIEEIAELAFDNLPQMRRLDLSNNYIRRIPSNGFGSLAQLKDIWFDKNNISEIAPGAFSKAPNLENFWASYNRISKIPDYKVFAQPNKIVLVSLSNTLIKKIQPKAFDKFDKILQIGLPLNQIEQISDTAFDNIPQVRIINLYDNKIKQILARTFKNLQNCTELDLDKNAIQTIQPGAFDGLYSLEKLSLENNSIQYIQAGALDGLKSVTWMSFRYNDIQKIDDGSFDKLKKLESLFFNDNPSLSLGKAPFGSNGLISLKYLSFVSCNLKQLPIALLKNLPKLLWLDLQKNQLTSIPPALRNTKSLTLLNLNHNNVTSIESNAFGNNPSLTQLDLNFLDKLSVVADCAFCGLTGLKHISLDNNNNLKQINENAFGFLRNSVDRTQNLTWLEIEDGGLRIVPQKLALWDKIRISILGNPANCDSRMDWLFRNSNYNLDHNPTFRYYDPSWCKQCRHDRVCQNLYGWNDTTTMKSLIR